MKKFLAILLALVMLVSFAACSAEEAVKDLAEISNKKITRGTIDGNVYSSEYAQFTFTKPDDWNYSTDEELAALINSSSDMISASSFEKTLADAGSVYDMMAKDDVTGSNIMVMFENLTVTNAGRSVTAEEYLDILKENLAGQTTDMTYNFMAQEDVTIGGNEYLKATFTVTIATSILSQVYYMRAIDNVMCVIISTPANGVTAEDIEAMLA